MCTCTVVHKKQFICFVFFFFQKQVTCPPKASLSVITVFPLDSQPLEHYSCNHSPAWAKQRLVSSTVGDTCCAHGFQAPTPTLPLLLPASNLLAMLVVRHGTFPFSQPHHYISCSSSPLSLSPISLFLSCSFLKPFCPLLYVLKCPTSNTNTAGGRIPLPPIQTCTAACSQTEAELLNGAAAREIKTHLHYEKTWQISSKTAALTREQGVQIKDAVCQVWG